MVNTPFKRRKCAECNTKIHKANPKLCCTLCNEIKHLKCQKLSKADAKHIIRLNVSWTCHECISQILPINACRPSKRGTLAIKNDKFKIQCSSCNGYSYSQNNVRTC